jgi:hypothetical protein
VKALQPSGSFLSDSKTQQPCSVPYMSKVMLTIALTNTQGRQSVTKAARVLILCYPSPIFIRSLQLFPFSPVRVIGTRRIFELWANSDLLSFLFSSFLYPPLLFLLLLYFFIQIASNFATLNPQPVVYTPLAPSLYSYYPQSTAFHSSFLSHVLLFLLVVVRGYDDREFKKNCDCMSVTFF